ncbi:ABC transporter substrate-binding protein [Sanguibacter sp. Z1732]|uniref:ABC transporter substrate-binding protein n=1 Tax=Sanguibacter sp. Z1732 TaxID=3435412 RepID=UPI003D9CB091
MKNRHISAIAVFVAASLTLAACGGNGTDDGPDAPGDGGNGESTGADTLNIGVHVEPTDWSPSRIQTILFPFTRQVYESLASYDDELNPSPELATEWEISDDQSAVTITLRDGVTFHSGEVFNAEAVAANLEFFANPETGQQMFGPMSAVSDWEVLDDLTLQVNFTDPVAELQITDLLQSWTIGDPGSLDDSSSGVGTGPFEFSEWVSGERIVLERNDDYWGEAPAYQTLNYRVFGDMDSLISGFESGVIDLAVDVPPLDAQRLEGQATVLTGNDGALIDQWRINPSVAPFDDENVRMAINYATDRQSIVDALYHGYADPATLPYGPHSPAYDAELAETLEFDLDRARQQLEDSGLSADELSASIMVTSANARTEQAAQILQASLGEIGFTLDIEVRDNAEYTEKMLAGDFQIVFSAIGNGQKYPTRITTNSIYRMEDNPVGATEIFPDYAPAVAAANSAVTEEEQAEAFAHLNEVLTEAMWVPTVGYLPTLWLTSDQVTGVDRDVDNMLLLAEAAPAN